MLISASYVDEICHIILHMTMYFQGVSSKNEKIYRKFVFLIAVQIKEMTTLSRQK